MQHPSRNFLNHLLGTRFLLRTDNRPLQHFHCLKDSWSRRARWLAEIQEYDSARVSQGSQNNVADTLSRLGFSVPERSPTSRAAVSQTSSVFLDMCSLEVFHQAQQADPAFRAAKTFVRVGRSPQPPTSNGLKRLLNQTLNLSPDGLLRRKTADSRWQLVTPESLIPQVLYLTHDNPTAGHYGRHKTVHRVLERFWWPAVHSDVAAYTRSCHLCALRKFSSLTPRAPLLKTNIKGRISK